VRLGGSVQLQGAQPGLTFYTTDVAVAPGAVATLSVNGGKSEVTVYQVR
jgi:hypothetical protein